MEKAYAFVHIIDIPYAIDKVYSYLVPKPLWDEIKIGSVVVVPFGNSNKKVSAVVVGLSSECEYPRPKPVKSVMQYPFDVPEELLKTCAFMKERFFCTFGSAFRTIIPPGVNLDTEIVYSVNPEFDLSSVNDSAQFLLREIALKKQHREFDMITEYGEDAKTLLDALLKIGAVIKESRVPERINEKNLFIYNLCIPSDEAAHIIETGEGLSEKQRQLAEFLTHYPAATMREIEQIGRFTPAIVNALIKKRIVERRETSVFRKAYSFDNIEPEKEFTLSEEQKSALDGISALIDSGEAKGALLFGVTGSGKTRVIIEAAKKVIKSGRQVIILIPEIGLASQAVKAYAAAFGDRLAVVHSMLSVGERTDTYRRVLAGDIDIVIGTRSAVFAPFTRLGMIAIDEEQAHTYKSEMQPRYSAIDIARFRCTESKGLMLLASATPSIESYYKAKQGVYSLFTLKSRFSQSELPEVIIEDMRDDPSLFSDKLIGKRLASELKSVKAEGGQSLLFVNRRGYNSHISCRHCGYVFTCPNCSVSLTHHVYEGSFRGIKRMHCHYCGYTASIPEICEFCGKERISFSGYGTQKLHEELENDFTDMKITRMDSDTTGGKFSHDKLIDEFASGQSDVLIGTQMISKGLDFPSVKLAGAISVDSSLYMDDFRASERTFSLVTQLVGRAGRAGKRGKAILQTYNPENEILKLAATQDYESFYESEIALRKAVVFPPFCSISVFSVSSTSEYDCETFANRFSAVIDEIHLKGFMDIKLIKFGPFRSGIYKVMGKFRQRIIVKYKDCARTREFLSKVLIEGLATTPKTVKIELDVNPPIV